MEQHSKQWIIDNLLPLGAVRYYTGNGNFIPDPDYINCRFIKERTSGIVRRGISNKSLTNYPDRMISYGYHHVITSALRQDPAVYHTLEYIGTQVEEKLSSFISSCDHAVVLFAHCSVVEQMMVHTHRLPDQPMRSLTVAIRLTNDDPAPIHAGFYPPLDPEDPQLEHYFNTAHSLDDHVQNHTVCNVQLTNERTLFVFNAALTPHTANFTNDIVLYFVYDNVEFISGSLEKIKNNAQQVLFQELDEYKRAYFWHL